MKSQHYEILEEEKRVVSALNSLKKIWPYIKRYFWYLIFSILFLILSTAIDLAIPNVIRHAIDNVLVSFKSEIAALKKITLYSSLFLILLLSQFVFIYFQVIFANLLGQKVILSIRKKLFKHITSLPIDFFSKNPTGKLTTRVVNDTQNLLNFFTDVLSSLVKDIVLLVGIMIVMFKISSTLTLKLFYIFPAVSVLIYVFGIFDSKIYRRIRTRLSAVNSYLAENISGITVTHLFNQEERKMKEFLDLSTRLYKARVQHIFLFAIFRPLLDFFHYFTIAILLYFGAKYYKTNYISLGTLYAFVSYIGMFFRPLRDIAEKYDIMLNSLASAEKVFNFFKEKSENFNPSGIRRIKDGKIEFKNVWFAYVGNDYVLKDVSFVINPKEFIAIVGETGSGKTTITKLINALYFPSKGKILIDDLPIEKYSLRDLRKQITYVPQDVFLFTGTILDNIRLFNKSISEEEVINATKKIKIHDYIVNMENGYKTWVYERGSTLSVGERQLIAFARAVLNKSKIVIFDEATANIDSHTEQLIQTAIEEIRKEATVISIAHRLSTIKNVDRIIVIHDGKKVEEGTHMDLLRIKGMYYNLYNFQKKGVI